MSLPNELQLYFGDDYVINKYITVHHPKLDDIIRMGEQEYFSMIYTFTSIPSDMKPQLWDIGICWEDISDFDLFLLLSQSLSIERTKVLFGDLDFSKFRITSNENNEPVLYQLGYDGNLIVIDEHIYFYIATFLRKIHNIKPKVEKAGSKIVRQILIEDDRKKQMQAQKENKGSTLLPIISSLINCPEFKYGLNEIREMPVYALMDSISRIQIIKSTTALLNGCYSGMIDTSKINKNEFNWMREIKER